MNRITLFRALAIRTAGIWLLATRITIGAVFLWSGIPKISRPFDFLANVYQYQLVGPSFGVVFATVIPWLEVTLGVSLLGNVLVSGALLATILIAATYTLANALALHHGLVIRCGCFGGVAEKLGYSTFVRSFVLMLLALAGFLISIRKISQTEACFG